MMNETEGVIKYTLSHQTIAIEYDTSMTRMNAWRTIFHQLDLIGQDSQRYQGYGYGNISQRLLPTEKIFIISGTQTGGIEKLSAEHYCKVIEARPKDNYLRSEGLIKPSSEALTHASFYHQSPEIQAVIHIHCPLIWHLTCVLQLPAIGSEVSYGTPEMAQAVEDLIKNSGLQQAVFSLLGHQDGIIAFAQSMDVAAHQLIQVYAQALAIEQNESGY